jgi:hypothetical protein
MVIAGRRAREPEGEEEVRRHRGAAVLKGEADGFLQGWCEFAVGLCATYQIHTVPGIGIFLMHTLTGDAVNCGSFHFHWNDALSCLIMVNVLAQ